MRKAIFYLLIFTFLFSIIGCSSEQVQNSKSGVFKQPIAQIPKVNSKGDTGRSLPPAEVPLMFWKSFEYKDISRPANSGHTKENFCVIKETEGIPVQEGADVQFIKDAECFFTHFTSLDGVPHKYMIGLIKIRIPETGEEGWTWTSAVDLKE
ncbi:MAG: hypothetical protein CL770_04305 [Chloroflexi bacterium]|nr:hypothetical protein [Chloroflexota bacterium]|tara:strand:+ start:4277 stop:4732 length:456 start_codon:yes stop_codon:yes gene_type:complete